MSERPIPQVRLPQVDLEQVNEALHAFLMMFAPRPAEPQAPDTSIDWEDGELEDQTEPPTR